MTELRPHFYPVPAERTGINWLPTGQRSHDLVEIAEAPFPKQALLELYAQTHRHLHRGSVKKLLTADAVLNMKIDLPEIVSWVAKIRLQLSTHIIGLNLVPGGKPEDLDIEQVIVCHMDDPSGRVQVMTALRGAHPTSAAIA